MRTSVRGWQGVAEGWLVRHGVSLITRVKGCRDCMEVHMERAWLMMCSHAHGQTRLHSGELGAVEVGAPTTMMMPARP